MTSINTPVTQLKSEGSMSRSFVKSKKGLTFLELILCIVVLGLFAAIVIPKFTNVGPAAQAATRATSVSSINDVLDGFATSGGTFGAAYNAGSSTTAGTIRNDTLANMLTDLAAGVYAGGIQYQIPSATVTWNGATPTIVNNRLQ